MINFNLYRKENKRTQPNKIIKNTPVCGIIPGIALKKNMWLIPKTTDTTKINKPIGIKMAYHIAAKYGIIDSIFTKNEFYKFLYGSTPKNEWKFDISREEVIKQTTQCLINLTNSIGGTINSTMLISPIINCGFDSITCTNIQPLSSYGLKYITKNNELYITTDCSVNQPCLNINSFLAGPLQQICHSSGCLNKAHKLLNNPLFVRCAILSKKCQDNCISTGCMFKDNGDYYGVPTQFSMWIVNFALIFMLRPELAAYMPMYKTKIPDDVAIALIDSNGEGIRYEEYKHLF